MQPIFLKIRKCYKLQMWTQMRRIRELQQFCCRIWWSKYRFAIWLSVYLWNWTGSVRCISYWTLYFILSLSDSTNGPETTNNAKRNCWLKVHWGRGILGCWLAHPAGKYASHLLVVAPSAFYRILYLQGINFVYQQNWNK